MLYCLKNISLKSLVQFQEYYDKGIIGIEPYVRNDSTDVNERKYKIKKWKLRNKSKLLCGLPAAADLDELPDFIACVSVLHNKAKVFVFREDNLVGNLVYDQEEDEENTGLSDFPGYQQMCHGDSGGGHWRKGGPEGDLRDVLIGVTSSGTTKCGLESYAHMLNNKEIIKWIDKLYCKRIKEDEPCFF